jgi:ATP-dependent RNA helicase DeaD
MGRSVQQPNGPFFERPPMQFSEMGLDHRLLKAIAAAGFEQPTPIQESVIPILLEKSVDLVGLAQTGTGKTAAYGLPLLQHIDIALSKPQALVVCPTRELCLQITGDLVLYARSLKKVHIVAVYGGSSIVEQMRLLKKGAHIIVATPGRLLDLIQRKAVKTNHIRYSVLDEADEMLSMGFQEDIHAILNHTPDTKRTWLFSATMPSAAAQIAKTFMKNPTEIAMGRRNISAENIDHSCYVVKEKDRYAALKRLIDYAPDIYGLIFCRTRRETRAVAEKLMKDGYNAEALHGDLSQEQRNSVMRKFRERTLQILVATDVAARGLDVDDISHVINYNLPDESERYTHRSGRTARAGKSGESYVLVNTREARRIPELERRTAVKFKRGSIPQGKDICERQLFAMVDKMVQVGVNMDEIEPYLPPVYKALGKLDKEELIRRFVSVEFNRFLDYYRNSADLNAYPSRSGKPAPKPRRLSDQNVQSLFINVGRLDNIHEGAIVRLICDKAGIRSDKIGQITLKREFSFVDVDKRVARKVFKSLKGTQLDTRKIEIRFADRAAARVKKKRRSRKK